MLDEKCVNAGILPITDLSFSFSQPQKTRFDFLYKKITIPRRDKTLTFQRLEIPHCDTVTKTGYTRRQIFTQPLQDLTENEFQIFQHPYLQLNYKWSTLQFRLFFYLKQKILQCFTKTFEEVLKDLAFFDEFLEVGANTVEIDVGALILAVSGQDDHWMNQLQSNSQPNQEISDIISFNKIEEHEEEEEETEEFEEFSEPKIDAIAAQEEVEIKAETEQKVEYQKDNEESKEPKAPNENKEEEVVTEQQLVSETISALREQLSNLEGLYPEMAVEDRDLLKYSLERQLLTRERRLQKIAQKKAQEEDAKLLTLILQKENEIKKLEDEQKVETNKQVLTQKPNLANPQKLMNLNKEKSTLLIKIQNKQCMQAQIPVLPACAFGHVSFTQTISPDDQLQEIQKKVKLMSQKQFLEKLYDETGDATVSQLVPRFGELNQLENASQELARLQQPQTLVLKQFAEGVRTGTASLADTVFVEGEFVLDRFLVVRSCGEATFSNCFEVFDQLLNRKCCFKVIKEEKEFLDQSFDEIRLLELVKKVGGGSIVELLDYFYFRERLVLVFPLLGQDLYMHQKKRFDLGAKNDYTLSVIQQIAKQQLHALSRLHAIYLLHLDVKPENILLKLEDSLINQDLDESVESVLVDLGSCSFAFDKVHQYIQSRSYRAPEIMLGSTYDQRVDIWSLGCVLAEMYTGKVLFPNYPAPTMLARQTAMFGPFKKEVLFAGRCSHKFLTSGALLWDEDSVLLPQPGLFEQWLFGDIGVLGEQELMFADFVRQMLKIDYLERPNTEMLLTHPFIDME